MRRVSIFSYRLAAGTFPCSVSGLTAGAAARRYGGGCLNARARSRLAFAWVDLFPEQLRGRGEEAHKRMRRLVQTPGNSMHV